MKSFRPIPYLKAGTPAQWLGDYAASTPEEHMPVGHPWLDGISVAYLVDSQDAKSYRYLTNRDIGRARLSRQELQRAATEALWAPVQQNLKVVSLDEDCFGLRLDGTLEASTVLLTELWSRNLAPGLAGGDLMMTVPTRDVVIYGSGSHPYSIKHMQKVIEKLWGNPNTPYLLSKKLFRWNQEHASWQVAER